MQLAGDSIVSSPRIVTNHGITIQASVADVWPWLVQMGQGRGGFYSYSWLENLIGCQIRNATSIAPAWQDLSLGDEVSLHPRAPKLIVADLRKDHHLALVQRRPIHWTWSFNLIESSNQPTPSQFNQADSTSTLRPSCRLVIRTRCHWSQWYLTPLLIPVMTVGHYAMERKMLQSLKKLCQERQA